MEWQKGNFYITDDKSQANLTFITEAVNRMERGRGRTHEAVAKSIENSVLLCMFERERQIGFSRVITDYVSFSWITDIYIHPDFRKIGLGRWLVDCTMMHPVVTEVEQCGLYTRNTRGLFSHVGFQRTECMLTKRVVDE